MTRHRRPRHVQPIILVVLVTLLATGTAIALLGVDREPPTVPLERRPVVTQTPRPTPTPTRRQVQPIPRQTHRPTPTHTPTPTHRHSETLCPLRRGGHDVI